MRAAVFAAPRQIELRKTHLPELGDRSVRVRLEGCGVCASNLPVWEGWPWFQYPLSPGQPGHEGWGIVESVGASVTRFRPGDRVALLSYHGYAEYDVASEDAVVALPDALAEKPFPGEPLGGALNVFKRSDIRAGQTVAIVGVGFLGVLLTQLAVRAGARVLAISRRRFALDLARQSGATEVIPWTEHQSVVQTVMALTAGHGCERVIEAVGHQAALDLASEIIQERGRLIIAGYHQDGLRQVNMQLWNWRGIDVINAHERDPKTYLEGIRAAIDAVTAGQLNLCPLFTHRFQLDAIGEAFAHLKNRPESFLKALILL